MEQKLQILINSIWISDFMDRLMSIVSNTGWWKPWIITLFLSLLIFGNQRLRRMISVLIIAVIITNISITYIKYIVHRLRPFQQIENIRIVELDCSLPYFQRFFSKPHLLFSSRSTLLCSKKGKSFPSAHSANNIAVLVVIIAFYRKRGWLYLPIALMVCYSRIYTGSHWPNDVLCGCLFGLISSLLTIKLLSEIWKLIGQKNFFLTEK